MFAEGFLIFICMIITLTIKLKIIQYDIKCSQLYLINSIRGMVHQQGKGSYNTFLIQIYFIDQQKGYENNKIRHLLSRQVISCKIYIIRTRHEKNLIRRRQNVLQAIEMKLKLHRLYQEKVLVCFQTRKTLVIY
ncbi:hypothetical protein pb186bvf_014291 [Paramecium bursaria]